MRVLKAGIDPRRFFRRLSGASARVLMLDYDGTLAPFTVRRDRALPFFNVWALVTRIARAGRSRVALASGRSVRNLQALVGADHGVELWGSHGAERLMPNGTVRAAPMPEEATRFLREAEAWIAQRGWGPLLERKPFGLAVHGRGEDPMMFSAVRDTVQEGLGAAALEAACDIVRFDGGIELRPRAHQKGLVVETMAAEEGSGAVLAYLGDDLTDEDAFRAVAGRGLAVLVRDRERPTSADLWIKPPGELLWFLDEWERAQAAPAGAREAVP